MLWACSVPSVMSDSVTLWTVARKAPLSMGFSRQEYWSGCHALLQGIFLTQGSNLCHFWFPHWQAGSLPLVPPGKVKVKWLSCVRLFLTPWAIAYQGPQSMEFSRQEYWSGLAFPSPGDFPNPGIKPVSPSLQVNSLPLNYQGSPFPVFTII